MPAFSDDDIAAITVLIGRYIRAYRAHEADLKIKSEVDARLQEYPKLFENFRGAFALFGMSDFTTEQWMKLREAMGDAAYTKAIAADPNTQKHVQNLEQLGRDIVAAAGPEKVDGTVKNIVLARLKLAGTKGSKAADIREYIEAARSMKLHDKTVGMTLYRLSQEGLVRRDGRTWFFVSPHSEAQNPGGETPGLFNRDIKKGEEL